MSNSTFYLILIFGIAVAAALPQTLPGSDFSERIVGGVQVTKNELPYQISLQNNGKHFCGGAIYSATAIITAAHCTTIGYPVSSLRVVAGEHNVLLNSDDGTEQIRSVSSVIAHHNYNKDTYENDIAIIKLSSPLTLNDAVAAIPLPVAGSTAIGLGVVSGWGRTLEDGNMASILRKVTIPIVTDERCKESYGSAAISSTMMCAGFELGGKDSCQGDSGGPFVTGTGANRVLSGVVSWGVGCARPNAPGVYTEVSKFVSWIQANAR